jgi:uncharacterized protein YndB with AHSA1/START domain
MTTTFSTHRSETRSIAISAPPDRVFSFLADPTNLPIWAPRFARAVEPEGDNWRVASDAGDTLVSVLAAPEQRTVDIVGAADAARGAFARVLPNGAGSEFLFTLFFGRDTEAAAVDAQMAVVAGELEAVRRLTEQ